MLRQALAALILTASVGVAEGQDLSITVTPFYDGRGATGYVGPYGRSLPGVQMFSGRAAPVTPGSPTEQNNLRGGEKFSRAYTLTNRPFEFVDAWHGTLGEEGFRF